jgi:hypothetical protein
MPDLPRYVLEDALEEIDTFTTPTREERRPGDEDRAEVVAGRLRQVRRKRRAAVGALAVWIFVATALLAGPVYEWRQITEGGRIGCVVGSGAALGFGLPKLAARVRAEQLYELLQQMEKSADPVAST